MKNFWEVVLQRQYANDKKKNPYLWATEMPASQSDHRTHGLFLTCKDKILQWSHLRWRCKELRKLILKWSAELMTIVGSFPFTCLPSYHGIIEDLCFGRFLKTRILLQALLQTSYFFLVFIHFNDNNHDASNTMRVSRLR